MIESPTNAIPVPEELKRESDKVKAQIAVEENEVQILKMARVSEQENLQSLINARKEEEQKYEDTASSIISMAEEKSKVECELDVVSKLLKKAIANLEEVTVKSEKLNSEMIEIKTELEERKNVVKVMEESMHDRNEKLKSREERMKYISDKFTEVTKEYEQGR